VSAGRGSRRSRVPAHIAGDSSYTEDAMLRGAVDGVGPDEEADRRTHERIRAYAESTPTVYLPSHDPETAARLAARRTVGEVRQMVNPAPVAAPVTG